jgi:hypothetical protein|tara:strand:- start:703 stop:1314 length:612 start_codon:yes stop_codon:yes gene_type:complete
MATVTSKLESINVMLTSIGESPVNTITSSTTTDVSIAVQILDNVSREVQSVGWHFNTDVNYKLAKNTSNQIVLPSNCLRVDNTHQDADLDLVERNRKLWDRKNHTYTIEQDVRVNITWLLEFTEIPETARRYITIRAARIFQDRMLASDTLHKFHQVDEIQALAALKEHEGDTRDHSIFDNYSTYRVIDRGNYQPNKTTINNE